MSFKFLFQFRLAIDLVGGATQSIFVNAEALLLSSSDWQNAIEYVAKRKKMDKYRSIIDFLFCELFPDWRIPCRRFYAGNGPPLKTLLTTEEVEEYDWRLCVAIAKAYVIFCEQRGKSWKQFREECFSEITN